MSNITDKRNRVDPDQTAPLFVIETRRRVISADDFSCDWHIEGYLCFLLFQSSGSQANIYHALLIIFLEFFSWGLLSNTIINVSQCIVVPTKSDSDVIFCLQLLNKTNVYLHFC